MNDLMKPNDEIVQIFLLPAIIGETTSQVKRITLITSSIRSLSYLLFSAKTCNELENSLTITAPLVALMQTK